MLNDASSSSSDDPFLTNGGVKHHVSMYSKLANVGREFDNKFKSDSPAKGVDLRNPKEDAGKNKLSVQPDDKGKTDVVVTISSSSDSDDEETLSLRDSLRARKRRGRPPRSEGGSNNKRRQRKDSGQSREEVKDVFAISDDDSDIAAAHPVGRGRKRRRTRNSLADIDADDEFESLNSASHAADLHTRRVLQAAQEAARTTDLAVLEAEAEKAAQEAAAAAEYEKAQAAERARLNENKGGPQGGNGASAEKSDAIPVVLKVRCGSHIHKLRIRKTDRLLKMLVPFCKKFGLDAARAEMKVDGESVGKDDTPITYDLEDMMMVEVVIRNN